MDNWQSDKAKYARVVTWKVVESSNALGKRLRIVATLPDGSERVLQGSFRDREQLDRYVDRFLPHLKGREAAETTVPAAPHLTEDQLGFLAFVADIEDDQVRSTYQSYCFLADFGRAEDIWKRDACREELLRRHLAIPDRADSSAEGPDLAPDCA